MLPLGLAGPVWLLPVAAFIQGVGFGFSFTALLISVQNSVGWEKRGAATSIYQFSRNLGGTVAGAIMGVVLTVQPHRQPGRAARRNPALPGSAGGKGGDQLGAAQHPARPGSAEQPRRRRLRLALQSALSNALSTVIWLLALLRYPSAGRHLVLSARPRRGGRGVLLATASACAATAVIRL